MPPPSPLIQAIRANRPLEVERLLAEGADPNGALEDRPWGAGSAPVRFPLLCAVGLGRIECVRLLARFGADLDLSPEWAKSRDSAVDSDNGRALFVAVARDNGECLRELLALGANPDVHNGSNQSPFFAAASRGSVQCLRMFASLGFDMEQADPLGLGAVDHAAREGRAGALRALAELGCALDIQGPDGLFPLHRAAIGGHVDCICFLEEAGVDFEAENSEGLKAFDLAQGFAREAISSLGERALLRAQTLKAPPAAKRTRARL